MGDKSWRASSDGPDWMDVMGAIAALEDTYRVSVAIGLHAGGRFGIPAVWHITIVRHLPVESVLGASVVDLSGEWPCKEHKEITHCLYAGLLRLDHELTVKLAGQSELPFTAE